MDKEKQEKMIRLGTKFKKLKGAEEKEVAALCLNAMILGKELGKIEMKREIEKAR